jgi:hypothetical protein
MAFLTANPLALGLAGSLAASLFGNRAGKKITVAPPIFPEPKAPPRGPISVSDTAGAQKAGIASRKRRGGGISGLILSGLGRTSSEPESTRRTLLGS